MAKISIINWKILTGIDYWKEAEVYEVSQWDIERIQSWLATFDVKSKKIVDVPQPEPTPEELEQQEAEELQRQKEAEIEEVEKMLLRKQALEYLEEDTEELDSKLSSKKLAIEKPKKDLPSKKK